MLKGYALSFSIDSTFTDRLFFKFTIKDTGVIVGTERVRRDFREYLERVCSGDADSLDDMPVIVSLEEHNLAVTILKNRISFLKHSYDLSQNATKFYAGLIGQMNRFAALPAPSVVVQTGGMMDSRKYASTNSSRLIQGDSNAYEDSSQNISIGHSFNERAKQMSQLDDLLALINGLPDKDEFTRKAEIELSKAKDELSEEGTPDGSRVGRWMGRAKELLSAAAISVQVAEAAKKLFEAFGIGS